MTEQKTWLNRDRFPRLTELYEEMGQLALDNVLAGFIRHGTFESLVQQGAEVLEGSLAQLDLHAWQHLKKKVLPLSCKRQETRGWQPFYDVLNECRGYVLLVKRGYSKITFLDERDEQTPDLVAEGQDSRAFVEVKTIHRSDYDLKRNDPRFLGGKSNRVGDIINSVGLAKKLNEKADPVSTFLWERLDKGDQGLLANANELSSKKDVHRILLAALNDVLQGDCIYELERFSGIPLRYVTKEYVKDLKGYWKDPPCRNFTFLNRWLLEDAYPEELTRLPDLAVDMRPNKPLPPEFKRKLCNTIEKAAAQLRNHASPSDKKIVLLIINRDLSCMPLRVKEIEAVLQQPDLEVICVIGDS
jgi:hypothetical protein